MVAMEQPKGKRTQKRRLPAAPASQTPKYEHSEAEKIKAVTAMLTANREHPLSVPALEAGCKALGHRVHHQTLSTWHKQYRETVIASLVLPTTAEIVTATRDEILEKLDKVRHKALDRAAEDEVINDAKFDKLMLGYGIAQTKMDEMVGLPSEDVALWHDLAHTAALAGVDHRQIIQDLVTHLKGKLPNLASIARDAQQQQDTENNMPAVGDGVK